MATKKVQPQTEQTETPKQTVTPVGKITVSSVVGKIKCKELPDNFDELPIMKVAGIIADSRQAVTQYGTSIVLQGQFAATNLVTGELFISKECCLPGAYGDAVEQSFSAAQKEDSGATLKFSCVIGAKTSPRDENKYEYVVRPVMETPFSNEAVLLLAL